MALVIRNPQMQTFEDRAEGNALAGLVRFLRADYPDYLPDVETRELVEIVQQRADKARAYGIQSKSGVETFTALTFTIGPEFDEFPPVRAIMLDGRYSPDDRLRRVLDEITPRQWAAARRRAPGLEL